MKAKCKSKHATNPRFLSEGNYAVSAIVSHTKAWLHMFFLTKCISISTGCKGMERQNTFVITQSGDKALLNVHQFLLNLMELLTVNIRYNRNFPTTIKNISWSNCI